MSHKYRLKYKIECGEFEGEELRKDPETGGCDALFYASVVCLPDGSFSLDMLSIDGRTGKEMSADESFKCWLLLGKILSRQEDLSVEKRSLALSPTLSLFIEADNSSKETQEEKK